MDETDKKIRELTEAMHAERDIRELIRNYSNPRCAHGATGSGGGSGWIVIF